MDNCEPLLVFTDDLIIILYAHKILHHLPRNVRIFRIRPFHFIHKCTQKRLIDFQTFVSDFRPFCLIFLFLFQHRENGIHHIPILTAARNLKPFFPEIQLVTEAAVLHRIVIMFDAESDFPADLRALRDNIPDIAFHARLVFLELQDQLVSAVFRKFRFHRKNSFHRGIRRSPKTFPHRFIHLRPRFFVHRKTGIAGHPGLSDFPQFAV